MAANGNKPDSDWIGNGDCRFFTGPSSPGLMCVIKGAREMQDFIAARDGLALWDTDEAEMEALSNDAIILLLELPLKKRDK